MDGWWLALGLGLAAAGCNEAPLASEAVGTNVAATPSSRQVATPLPAAPSSEFARCTDAAGGADPLLAGCAEAEITRVQDALSARWRAAGVAPSKIAAAQEAFRSALPRLAPASATRGTLDRLLAITRAMTITGARAHFLTGGSAPTANADVAEPSASAKAAWEESRALACAISPVSACERGYDALLNAKDSLDMNTPRPPAATIALPLPTCSEVRRSALVGGALAEAFDARYPPALNDVAQVESIDLGRAQIGNIVGYLACVAGLTDGDVGVADTGLTLFASKRHGAAALAALDRLGKGDAPEAAGARRFAEQMRAYLERDDDNG